MSDVDENGSVVWVPWVAAVFGVAAVIGVLFILRCDNRVLTSS